MRISCDVDVSNRMLPSFNLKKAGKSSHSQLSIGKKPSCSGSTNQEIYLMICTKQDRNGAKYRLHSNIEQFFTKFVQQGKATVRFSTPPHDLLLSKADPMQLRCFVALLQRVSRDGGADGVRLSTLAPASHKQVEKAVTKLVVSSRSQYPAVTASFPASLQLLHVNHCGLNRVELRILKLRELRVLDLSDNRLRALPDDVGGLTSLAELRLADNQLDDIPPGFCGAPLASSLQLLDVSGNRFGRLPAHVGRLRALVTLRLDRNQLRRLPEALEEMRSLKVLSATHNRLEVLPAAAARFSLDSLDLYGNAFLDDGVATARGTLPSLPSLKECAARAIKKHRIAYSNDDVGYLSEYLASGKRCVCGTICFESYVRYLARLDLRRLAASVAAIDVRGRMHAPCEAFLCSVKCCNEYNKR